MRFVAIATFLETADARDARAFLEARGIEAVLLDSPEDLRLLVRSSSVPKALLLLDRDGSKPSCPRCGSTEIHPASSAAFLPKRWRCICGHHWRKWHW